MIRCSAVALAIDSPVASARREVRDRLRSSPYPSIRWLQWPCGDRQQPHRPCELLFGATEYGAGVDEYQITLPKGAYEHGEDWRDAANRELKEEAGYGARKLTLLKRMTLSPGYMGHHITVALAEDLYEERLPGDEPEPLEVIPWKLSRLDELLQREDVTEARVIAALLMTQRLMDR